MTKIYAIVKPAFTMSGDGLADISYVVIAPFHKLFYERVCGYSLGHHAVFFDTMNEAKSIFEKAVASNVSWISLRLTQSVIIELELDQGKITEFCKIHTVNNITQKKSKKEEGFFKKIDVPVWEELAISSADVTVNALAEINRQYQIKNEEQYTETSLITNKGNI